jgi:hypothetical protein
LIPEWNLSALASTTTRRSATELKPSGIGDLWNGA